MARAGDAALVTRRAAARYRGAPPRRGAPRPARPFPRDPAMPRVDHVVFRVADLQRSIRFYESVLPARTIARRDGKDRWLSRVAWLAPEGQQGFAVVLIQPTRVRWMLAVLHAVVPRFARSFEHFGLACDSRDEVQARFENAVACGGRPLNAPAQNEDGGGFVAEVADPDGNPIEWTFGQRWG